MNHIIRVSILRAGTPDERVRAYPNPLKESAGVDGGDTVIWLFDAATVGKRDLQVLFSKEAILPLPNLPVLPDLVYTNPLGPLSSLSVMVGGIVGTFRLNVRQAYPRLFYYQFFENGRPLKWYKEAEGASDEDGGGIEIPMTPMPPEDAEVTATS